MSTAWQWGRVDEVVLVGEIGPVANVQGRVEVSARLGCGAAETSCDSSSRFRGILV